MAQQKKPGLELFDAIEGNDESASTSQTTTKGATPTSSNDVEGDEDLADLQQMINAPRVSTSTSRPETPQHAISATTSTRTRSPTGKRSDIYTPTTGSGRSSEEKAQAEVLAAESEQTTKAAPTPQEQAAKPAAQSGGGWWGGISAMATAAVKQAEAAVREIQKNEEAQKWAEQVKGNYSSLRGLGDELRTRAIPTFTTLLHTLAPPISQHERLQIHITHDLVNYPSLDPLIHQTFSRVMSQVEGGDLLVIQRGSETTKRRTSDAAYKGGLTSGWNDGPWWREAGVERSAGAVKGLPEGTKLVRVAAETYGSEFFAAKGGVEEAAKAATQNISESNPVRSSDIFLAIQAICYTAADDLFASTASAPAEDAVVVDEKDKPDELVTFAIYLHDPIHSINFSTLSQAFPQKWIDWIDAKSVQDPEAAESAETSSGEPQLPEEILDIIRSGGVDPREWVAEWMEDTLSLAVGVLAQRYVARRMGVGEGGLGRGKRREEVVESGGGEAARAL